MGLPFGLAYLADTILAISTRSTVDAGDCLFFHTLAQIHPAAVVGGYLAWAGIVLGLILVTPEVIGIIVTILAVFGHAAGAYTQLTSFLGSWWYQAANATFLVAAVALGTGLWWSAQAAYRLERLSSETAWPPWLHWALIALLLAGAGGMILVPWRPGPGH
jgi:hypothetical protein